jgi:hypothetical protein
VETEARDAAKPDACEPVWTFRSYAMRPGEFNTAMVHYYRSALATIRLQQAAGEVVPRQQGPH